MQFKYGNFLENQLIFGVKVQSRLTFLAFRSNILKKY